MKNLFLFILLVTVGIAQAQTTVFTEDFETLPLNVTSSGSSSWARTSILSSNGLYADSATIVSNGDTTYLTTNAFSTIGYTNAILSFKQICKLSFGDAGYIEVSGDSGATWTRLIGTSYLCHSTEFVVDKRRLRY